MADAAQSDGDLIVASDTEGNGVGDIVFKTGQVERGRIRVDGAGTGLFGGSQPYTYGVITDGTTITVRDKNLSIVSSGNDLGAILSALDATNATFVLGPGTFPSSTRAGFTHANVAVIGVTPTSTVIASTSDGTGSNDSVFKWRTGATFGVLRNLTITTTSTASGVIWAEADGYCEWVTVTCGAATTIGVNVQSTGPRCRVVRCTVTGAKNVGIELDADDCTAEHCSLSTCGDGTLTTQAGINVGGAAQRCRVIYNTCTGNGTHGIRYASTGADGPQIIGNKCRTNGALAAGNSIFGTGITLTSASGCAGGVVAMNRCTGNYENGIGLAVNGSVPTNLQVSANYSAGNNVGGFAGGHGIEVDAPGSAITGNVCTGNNNGISITASAVTVCGNTCYSNSGTQGNGIAVNGAGCTVTGNTCHDNGNDGVKLFTNTTGTVGDNTLYSNTGYGLEVTATGRIVVGTHNAFSNTAGQGTFASGSLLIGWLGTGTPASVVTAAVGSTFQRTDGGTSTTFYVKESGTGNTGWVAK